MSTFDGNAIVYCEGAFNTPNGKTAHGLVSFTKRSRVVAITINQENLHQEQIPLIFDAIQKCIGLPAFDVLKFGASELVEVIKPYLN